MHSSENAGLVKFDILGLTALTVINKTLKMLATKNIKLNITKIDLKDSHYIIYTIIVCLLKNV